MNDLNPKAPSRREAIAAGGGILVTSLVSSKAATGQDSAAEKDLVFRTTDPRNAEPQLGKLVQSWITPTEHFYVRSHAPNPIIDPNEYRLSIEGMVREKVELSLAQLREFSRRDVTATLTCAGNRRHEYNREAKVGGVQWEAGAIGNARWGGVSLAEVLRSAEVLEDAKHVWFEGLDQIQRSGGVIPFGASIPIEKAMIDDDIPGTLLCDEMNGTPLSADHGFPLRTVVPGYIGARSVKWLGRIVVSDRPSPNHYVATAYKIVKSTSAIDWAEAGPIYRYPINGAICSPAADSSPIEGETIVRGYVLPSGRAGSKVRFVSVSADNGKTWKRAQLTGTDSEYCWQLWQCEVDVPSGAQVLLMRATDSTDAFMPPRVPWNAKGYLQNSWFRANINR